MNNETYTREELNRLVDVVMLLGNLHGIPPQPEGFQRYSIKGIYVSPEVIERNIQERLEAMAK